MKSIFILFVIIGVHFTYVAANLPPPPPTDPCAHAVKECCEKYFKDKWAMACCVAKICPECGPAVFAAYDDCTRCGCHTKGCDCLKKVKPVDCCSLDPCRFALECAKCEYIKQLNILWCKFLECIGKIFGDACCVDKLCCRHHSSC